MTDSIDLIAAPAAIPGPRTRDEPLALGSISLGNTSPEQALADYLAADARERQRHPDAYRPLGVCRHCSVSLGETLEDKVIPIGAFGFLPNVCCPSCSEAGKERLAAEDRKARQQLFYSGHVPDEFFTWDDSRGNNAALTRAVGKFSFTSRRNLVLQGTTGSCKTRIAWELVKRIIEQPEPLSFLWLDAFDASTKGIPEEAFKAQFLFLDDLGNEQMSQKYATGLLRLFRSRCDWHRPFIITTQLAPSAFAKRFFEGATSEAIMRRMKQRTDSILTD